MSCNLYRPWPEEHRGDRHITCSSNLRCLCSFNIILYLLPSSGQEVQTNSGWELSSHAKTFSCWMTVFFKVFFTVTRQVICSFEGRTFRRILFHLFLKMYRSIQFEVSCHSYYVFTVCNKVRPQVFLNFSC